MKLNLYIAALLLNVSFCLHSCSSRSADTKPSDEQQLVLTDSSSIQKEAPLLKMGGQLMSEFDCPDSKFYPPVRLKEWNKVPVVNGRLPTLGETNNGTSVLYYGEDKSAYVKPYSMKLPRLAYCYSSSSGKKELVIVIQIIQSAADTVVAYRYLSGGCGGSKFCNAQFLSDQEVQELVNSHHE